MDLCRLILCQLTLAWAVLAQGDRLDLPVCLDSFDIHQDKIIRTQDSRAMGAKYINERDVSSREECLRLCCETQDCDVFVFEEKTPGSCYLFQCGTPEDFKCKFTKHHNYTSAVLVVNRHLTELESQIKHTQHEHELAKLRKPESEPVSVTMVFPSSTVAPGSKEIAPVAPTSYQLPPSRRCSRYQFECHGSGECIAIYNACDGIPQCADGSDEAPELGCPAQASTTVPAAKMNVPVEVPNSLQQTNRQNYHQVAAPSLPEDSPPAMPVLSKQFKNNQWTPQMFESQHMNNPVNYMQPGSQQQQLTRNQQLDLQQPPQQQQQAAEFPQSPPQLVNQAKQFGREGEGLLYRPPSELLQWPPPYQQDYRAPSSGGGSQIFSHKGSGLVAQTDRYRHVHGNKVVGEGGITGQFEPMQDYNRYNNYYEGSLYHKPPQTPNNWQPLHKPPHDMSSIPGVEEVMNNLPPNAPPGQDYYYEESFRTRLQPQMIPQRLAPQNNLPIAQDSNKVKKPVHKGEAEVDNQELMAEVDNKAANSNTSVKKAGAHHSPATNATDKPKESHHHSEHHHNSHRKVETLSAELSLTENSFDSDMDGQNVNPRGAILSLTMGLCVTGIMLVLVGCRMRMVRRRMRRGSKSPYAHDADFLVNGMYL
ncbi:uncharacterized protein LOC124357034 isoform X1 [Homalodisca vitripennis]|uniref:uncharacterized protein LOC124357034 isoform X1 n=1 Tax=Homalodisca vitripennis TaxID=197043 RepID=UPI001EEAD0DA|nr:uncharacterized protein LOC124357034 isoform X1 [Homalodisca vitripennis]